MTPLHRNNSNDRCLRSRPIGEDEVEVAPDIEHPEEGDLDYSDAED